MDKGDLGTKRVCLRIRDLSSHGLLRTGVGSITSIFASYTTIVSFLLTD